MGPAGLPTFGASGHEGGGGHLAVFGSVQEHQGAAGAASSSDPGAGPRLLALHNAIKPQAERYLRIYVSALLDQVGRSVREHTATVRAIQAGDPTAAHQAVRINWQNAGEHLGGVIDTMGERGIW